MSRPIKDKELAEIEDAIFSRKEALNPALRSTSFCQKLLRLVAENISLSQITVDSTLSSRDEDQLIPLNERGRRLTFMLMRYLVLYLFCVSTDTKLQIGALIVAYRCQLDHPFNKMAKGEGDPRPDSDIYRLLCELLDNLRRVVDDINNSITLDEYKLIFPDFNKSVLHGLAKTSAAEDRQIFMDFLREYIQRALSSGLENKEDKEKLEIQPSPPAQKKKAKTKADPLGELLIRHLAGEYENLVPPRHQFLWNYSWNIKDDHYFPCYQILGHIKPLTRWPYSLIIPLDTTPVSFAKEGILDSSEPITLDEFALGKQFNEVVFLLGEIGSGRTTYLRRLGSLLAAKSSGRDKSPLLLIVDCADIRLDWMTHSIYDLASRNILASPNPPKIENLALAKLLKRLTNGKRIIWVLDHIYQAPNGEAPPFIEKYYKQLGAGAKLILVPEIRTLSFLQKLSSLFSVNNRSFRMKPITDDQAASIMAQYAKEAVKGYEGNGEVINFANGLITKEQEEMKQIDTEPRSLVNLLRRAESDAFSILMHKDFLEDIISNKYTPQLSMRTPLAATIFCMASEMKSLLAQDELLLSSLLEKVNIPFTVIKQKDFQPLPPIPKGPDFQEVNSLRRLARLLPVEQGKSDFFSREQMENCFKEQYPEQNKNGNEEAIKQLIMEPINKVLQSQIIQPEYANPSQFRFITPEIQGILATHAHREDYWMD